MAAPVAAAMGDTSCARGYPSSFTCVNSCKPRASLEVDSIIFILILQRSKLRQEGMSGLRKITPLAPALCQAMFPAGVGVTTVT